MPSVLLAVNGEARLPLFREMIRRCSVDGVESFTSLKYAVAALRAHARKWDIWVVDGEVSNAVSEIESIRQEMGTQLKILLMIPGWATRGDVIRAARAGVNELILTPFSQVMLEDKMDRLMGKPLPQKMNSAASIFSRAS